MEAHPLVVGHRDPAGEQLALDAQQVARAVLDVELARLPRLDARVDACALVEDQQPHARLVPRVARWYDGEGRWVDGELRVGAVASHHHVVVAQRALQRRGRALERVGLADG